MALAHESSYSPNHNDLRVEAREKPGGIKYEDGPGDDISNDGSKVNLDVE